MKRHTADSITDDALDQLYENATRGWRRGDRWKAKAEQLAAERDQAVAATVERIRVAVRRLAAHAVGFRDVLDESDHGPWGKTVAADIAELRRLADEAQQPTAGEQPGTGPVPCGAEALTVGWHYAHDWEPQPGMTPVHCPGTGGTRPVPDTERRERYAAAITATSGWVLDGGQHMVDAVIAVADEELADVAAERDALLAELGGRHDEARERWIQKQLDETGIRAMDFRNGAEMELEPARELLAHWVAAARTMLGDAPNYTETKVAMDIKVAESPETYTLVVQRHAPGALTPHEARAKAEAELERAEAAIARARKLATQWAVLRTHGGAAYELRKVLDQEAE
ncbi:hypothetical protein [Streptomyces odonnellii]|uniref:hypothetical protein n=1 Tax=Streptomyces odonnellii TaxID=1417980 RepID=UPI000625E093|nr:hypothetical protein [Streptomyces odonnellii]